MLDESKVASVCTEDNLDKSILVSLIVFINAGYGKIRKGELRKRSFEELLTEALSHDDRVDLLSFSAYKSALGKYYSAKRHHTKNKTAFVMTVESQTPQKARIRVSPGMSMEFKALRERGILTKNGVAHTSTVIHTHRDVRDSDVMKAAEAFARNAMNSFRKTKKKKRKGAA